MVGTDSFCSISGARYFDDRTDVVQDIASSLNKKNLKCIDIRRDFIVDKTMRIGSTLIKRLRFSQEDVDASKDLVMFCPYISRGNQVDLHTDYGCTRPETPSKANIATVFDVVPSGYFEPGSYTSKDGKANYYVCKGGTICLVMYTAFTILKQAAPRIEPHVVYALWAQEKNSQGNLPGVDYGPQNELFEEYVRWHRICDLSGEGLKEYEDGAPAFWKKLLAKSRKTEEILRDAWGRPGNLWAFVRPDRFPVRETLRSRGRLDIVNEHYAPRWSPFGPYTLLTCATDVQLHIFTFLPVKSHVALMGVCKQLRSLILRDANLIAYRTILNDEPWLLPAGPFDLNHETRGSEEVDWWKAKWAKGGLTGELADLVTQIPWISYRIACSNCYSMWNRKRIWGIAKQIEALALEKGLI